MKKLLIILFLFCGFIYAQEEMIDTGLATESNKKIETVKEVTSTPIREKDEKILTPTSEETVVKKPTETQIVLTPTFTAQEKVEIDTEAKDTEGIIILSPGEVEPEILSKYIKYEKPQKEKVEVEETEKIIEKEKSETEEEQTGEEEKITFDYKEAEAEVILIEGTKKKKIEKAGYLLVEKAGFISQNFTEDGFIFSPEKDNSLLQVKFVYVNITVGKPVKKGDKFLIYDDSEEVFNPITDEYVGRMINISGIIKIIKKVKDNTYRAKIIKNYGLIKEGNKIKLRKEISDYHNKISKRETKKLTETEGFIIKAKDKDKDSILIKKDIVYMDKGLDNGIFPGVKMSVFRGGDKGVETDKVNEIGQILVINSMKNNSTGIIVSQRENIKIGDIIRTIK